MSDKNQSAAPEAETAVTAPTLAGVRGYVFDIDGTLALADKRLSGYQALPGARELLALLRERGLPYVGFTDRKSVE